MSALTASCRTGPDSRGRAVAAGKGAGRAHFETGESLFPCVKVCDLRYNSFTETMSRLGAWGYVDRRGARKDIDDDHRRSPEAFKRAIPELLFTSADELTSFCQTLLTWRRRSRELLCLVHDSPPKRLFAIPEIRKVMAERGISVDHSTVHRWAIKLLPVLEKAFSPPQTPRRQELARR